MALRQQNNKQWVYTLLDNPKPGSTTIFCFLRLHFLLERSLLRTIGLIILKFKPTVRETVVSLTQALALLRLRNVAAIQEQQRKETEIYSENKPIHNQVRHYRTYSTLYGIAGLEVLTISLARSVSAAIRSNTDNITHDTATHRYTNINHYLSSATTGFIYPCGE
ncbi:hypothetical protein T4C_11303 [Trichinella pseudospiralis]|uniref:Uncharacterized protein n=1 Tax=Trichinella pseudospiralis TaxID=6337 RepID=A0A0V1K360_TRIPS|nr:hypothetical protein T4C_11303 [Trichinella pseudospiralis]